MSAFDIDTLRQAFGSFMTGVTVVTAKSASNELVGFTANSFTSVSLDPPLLLVCPGRHLSSIDVFNSCSHFAVSVLAEGQESIANLFAKTIDDRFEKLDWRADEFGSPLIADAIATFSCSVYQRHEAGDHTVLIGQVHGIQVTEEHQGLGYSSQGYFSLSDEQQSDASGLAGYTAMAGAIIELEGRVVIVKDKSGASLPCIAQTNSVGARTSLQSYFEKSGLSIELGTVYSIYDDPKSKTRFTFIRATAIGADISALGTLETIDSLDALDFQDKAQATMMSRYAAESRLNQFGVYVGSADSGDIHPLDKPKD